MNLGLQNLSLEYSEQSTVADYFQEEFFVNPFDKSLCCDVRYIFLQFAALCCGLKQIKQRLFSNIHCFQIFGSVTLVHLFNQRLLPSQNKKLNLELPLPESKLDLENLLILYCFSLKL